MTTAARAGHHAPAMRVPFDLSPWRLHPVIDLPVACEVFDFTRGYDPERALASPYGIGRYDEKRPGMYTTALFARDRRDVHVGVDLAAPVGTAVRAFFDGVIHRVGYNAAPGDYGHTVVTEHAFGAHRLWALHGHLSAASTARWREGDRFAGGDVIAWIGDRHENGGWNPHVHFQLSLEGPATADLPGVVSDADRDDALRRFPDPRWVLGMIYP